jgi:hypothetical protein
MLASPSNPLQQGALATHATDAVTHERANGSAITDRAKIFSL